MTKILATYPTLQLIESLLIFCSTSLDCKFYVNFRLTFRANFPTFAPFKNGCKIFISFTKKNLLSMTNTRYTSISRKSHRLFLGKSSSRFVSSSARRQNNPSHFLATQTSWDTRQRKRRRRLSFAFLAFQKITFQGLQPRLSETLQIQLNPLGFIRL